VLGEGERVALVGWSHTPITARAWSPASGSGEVATSFDTETNVWELAVDVGSTGWIRVHLGH
jgi:hypothetical protein